MKIAGKTLHYEDGARVEVGHTLDGHYIVMGGSPPNDKFKEGSVKVRCIDNFRTREVHVSSFNLKWR